MVTIIIFYCVIEGELIMIPESGVLDLRQKRVRVRVRIFDRYRRDIIFRPARILCRLLRSAEYYCASHSHTSHTNTNTVNRDDTFLAFPKQNSEREKTLWPCGGSHDLTTPLYRKDLFLLSLSLDFVFLPLPSKATSILSRLLFSLSRK
jgi:hypothetical protein